MMRPEHLQSVIQPILHVINQVAGVLPTVERVQMVTTLTMMHGVCIGVGLEGEAEGGIYLICERPVGRQIAAKMTGTELTEEQEEAVNQTLMELVNMIAGNSVGLLSRAGLKVGITPPTAYQSAPALPYGAGCAMVFMNSPVGMIKFCVVIAEKNQ